MKLKLDSSGKAEVQDGKPVYVHDDGKEIAFDAPAAVATIKRVSDERDSARTEAGKHADALKVFEGLDAKTAKAALDKLADLERKKLIDAGEVEKVKDEINKAWEAKHQAATDALNAEKAKTRQLTVGARFASDPHFATVDGKDPLTFLTPDIAERVFGEAFEPGDGGRITAKYPTGQPVYSREKPGELADFSEAIGMLIEAYPRKDSILRDRGGSGAGARGGAAADGHGNGRGKQMRRAAFDALPSAQRSAFLKEGGALTD